MKKFTNKVKFVDVKYDAGKDSQTKGTYVVTLDVHIPFPKKKEYFDTKPETLEFLFKDIVEDLERIKEELGNRVSFRTANALSNILLKLKS